RRVALDDQALGESELRDDRGRPAHLLLPERPAQADRGEPGGRQRVAAALKKRDGAAHAITDRWDLGAELPDSHLCLDTAPGYVGRSEEHTSELQSRFDLVCR